MKKWTLDSIRCLLLVTCVDVRCSRNFPKDGMSYSYRAIKSSENTLVQELRSKRGDGRLFKMGLFSRGYR